MHIFYVPDVSIGVFSEEESLHAIKVLRLNAGDEVLLVDGIGGYYTAKIGIPHHKRCSFELVQSQLEYGKRPYQLHIAIAPTKNMDRLEWFVEKATEIGVDTITPIICQHSERKQVKLDRLEKIVVSAAKQSIKAYFPKVNPLSTFSEFIKEYGVVEQKFIAHCHEQDKRHLKDECQAFGNVLLMIGPEGDFSIDEVSQAMQKGFVPVSLGESRLRTETAALVGVCTVSLINE